MFASLELLLLQHSLGQSLRRNKKKEKCSRTDCATSISDSTETDVYVATQSTDSSHLSVNLLAILLTPQKENLKKSKVLD